MAWMKLSQYRRKYFAEGSRPALNTIKKWIDNGELHGKTIGGMYYVDPEAVEPANDLVLKVLSNDTQTQKARQ